MTKIKEITKDWENDYKAEILEIIENNFNGSFTELIDYLDDPNYSGELSEYADNFVDSYIDDLFEWGKKNSELIDEYVFQMGVDDKNFNIKNVIQGAQWFYYEGELYNACTDLKNYLETDEVKEKYPELFI